MYVEDLNQVTLRLWLRNEINLTGLTPAPSAILAALAAIIAANEVRTYQIY